MASECKRSEEEHQKEAREETCQKELINAYLATNGVNDQGRLGGRGG